MVRFSVPILPICLVGGVVKVSIEKCPTCPQIRSRCWANPSCRRTLSPSIVCRVERRLIFVFTDAMGAGWSAANRSFGCGPTRSTFGANKAPTTAAQVLHCDSFDIEGFENQYFDTGGVTTQMDIQSLRTTLQEQMHLAGGKVSAVRSRNVDSNSKDHVQAVTCACYLNQPIFCFLKWKKKSARNSTLGFRTWRNLAVPRPESTKGHFHFFFGLRPPESK